ncbi:MAG: hypothetical protein IJG85_02950, partial [Eubacteriaceae bacterium]|nr:hypothetical protein [Eubacteriaceae bacterium]
VSSFEKYRLYFDILIIPFFVILFFNNKSPELLPWTLSTLWASLDKGSCRRRRRGVSPERDEGRLNEEQPFRV